MKRSHESVSCTDWYPGTVLPVRSGVYQRRFAPSRPGRDAIVAFAYFNADTKQWHLGFTDWEDLWQGDAKADAEMFGKSCILLSDFEWRGVDESSQRAVPVRT